MSDNFDDVARLESLAEPHPGATPEEWLGAPDPVRTFGSTVERALQQLAQELAGLRAERDGLRLELEGLRTQLDLVRSQLNDRERFTSTVRELGEIVRNLNVPTDWIEPAPAPATAVTPAVEPPVVAAPVELVEAGPELAPEREPEPERVVPPGPGWLRKTLVRIGAVIGALLIVIVLLISLGPKVAPYETYYVRSGSMEPTFNTGDLIVLGKKDASDIHKGDIITFERPDKRGSLVTHRVVAVETTPDGKQFQTKGDANNAPDAWRVPATGNVWRYKFRVAKVGYVFGYLSTRAARLALLAIPAVLLGLLWLIEIWRPEKDAADSVSRSGRGRAAR